MSFDDWAIKIENVTKTYALNRSGSGNWGRLFGRSKSAARRTQEENTFTAVREVSLTVKKGQTVGIVGRNGSGKSTLLQMICGTIQPTSGQIATSGKIAALLELGAGFNSEFTGRENVFINAALNGMSRAETRRKLDAIIEFADIGSFIDQPVKSYSSGMYVRLAFASAINADAELLIVDEALAVGDEAFQRKCFARIKHLQSTGTTVLFVSHSVQSVIELCDHAILLDGGEMIVQGHPKAVTSSYQRLVHAPVDQVPVIRQQLKELAFLVDQDPGSAESAVSKKKSENSNPPLAEKTSYEAFDPFLEPTSRLEYAQKGARLFDVRIANADGEPCNILDHGKRYYLSYCAEFHARQDKVVFAMMVKTIRGLEVFGQWSAELGEGVCVSEGERFEVSFAFDNCLLPGTYFCNAGIFSGQEGDFSILHRVVDVGMFKVAPFDFPNHMRGLVSAQIPDFRQDLSVRPAGKAGQAGVSIRSLGCEPSVAAG